MRAGQVVLMAAADTGIVNAPSKPALTFSITTPLPAGRIGMHYDPQAAHACVSLFQEQKYVLPN